MLLTFLSKTQDVDLYKEVSLNVGYIYVFKNLYELHKPPHSRGEKDFQVGAYAEKQIPSVIFKCSQKEIFYFDNSTKFIILFPDLPHRLHLKCLLSANFDFHEEPLNCHSLSFYFGIFW